MPRYGLSEADVLCVVFGVLAIGLVVFVWRNIRAYWKGEADVSR